MNLAGSGVGRVLLGAVVALGIGGVAVVIVSVRQGPTTTGDAIPTAESTSGLPLADQRDEPAESPSEETSTSGLPLADQRDEPAESPPEETSTSSLPLADQPEEPAQTAPVATYTGAGASSAQRVEVVLNPQRVYQLLQKDAIRPVYDPQFVPAEVTPLGDRDYVLGVALNGDARAYPIGILRFREMVNDTVGGVPVLVTW